MEIYSLGIDPGWKNLGIALVKKDEEGKFSVEKSGVLDPSSCEEEFGTRWAINQVVWKWAEISHFCGNPDKMLGYAGLERYVAYKGVDTGEAENIQLVIGSICGSLGATGLHPFLYRAFDWKRELCQYLVKEKGFSNPSTSFDKKYSIAAAKACLDYPYTFKTDHEADAIAIAFTNFIHKEK